ncbi:TetR family transcriptional regulator [Phytomonospora endophytica]|uniref:AcrR family transcriptional regulator n=1 Tax=Phytomonospora endophytica TaxID=714109 RepID=A0A841FIP3_9ACTN|nr:TetR family transcriptional regulator [Phytomonospora endophytica]MBB6034823.1 AcrR family transcriptional regulator [Phytomonospora endophytica]GIG68973.1 TetR family transcriptional regulator [Phytomonospora endophytica]
MTTPPATNLTQRMRRLVSAELTEAALRLMAADGFDAVTIDQIAAAAGVSRRTFFRHYASKEDVVVRFLTDMGADITATLSARPAGEPPSVALRHALGVPLAACAGAHERARQVVGLILGTPALLARFLERQSQWQDDLAAALAERLGTEDGDLYPRMAAGMALTAFDTALHRWNDGGHDDPGVLADRAFAIIAPALDAVERTA